MKLREGSLATLVQVSANLRCLQQVISRQVTAACSMQHAARVGGVMQSCSHAVTRGHTALTEDDVITSSHFHHNTLAPAAAASTEITWLPVCIYAENAHSCSVPDTC